MGYWSRISPRGAVADLVNEWRKPTPYRWPILGLSVALTVTMLVVLIPDSQRIPPPRPEITYITTFAPDRTEAEIVASNLANQKRKEEHAAALAAAEERRKEAYRTLGRASGFDVDKLERYYTDRFAEDPAPAPPASEQ